MKIDSFVLVVFILIHTVYKKSPNFFYPDYTNLITNNAYLINKVTSLAQIHDILPPQEDGGEIFFIFLMKRSVITDMLTLFS